jgi:CheY-like chemotaxis protein
MTKILLVEDDELNRDMLLRRLERKGMEVEVAVNGREAIEKSTQDCFDVVLMDISLPVMDGYEATRTLRAQAKTKNLPIIGLSAHAMVGDREKALQAGCDDYDTKPVDLPRLLAKINALLGAADRN